MSKIQIGICTSPEMVGQLAPGYDYVEFVAANALSPLLDNETYAPQLEELKQQVTPPIRAFNSFVPASVKLVGPEVDWNTVETYVERAFARAAALGGKTIGFGSGGARMVPVGFSRALAWGQLVRFCTLCARQSERTGVVLAIEPLNHKECNIVNSYAEACQLARDVAQPDQVRGIADRYHFVMDGEPLSHIEQGAEWLSHVHLADSKRLWPGSGGYPLERLFRILHELGYEGMASAECGWGDDFGANTARSLAFMRNLA